MVAKEAKIAKEKKEKTKKAKDEAPDKFASDPRSQRTEAQIFSAFDELLSEKELSKITVTMLTKRAGISRKTFYLHYGSIDDLVDELLRREMATVGETLRSIPLDENGRIDAGGFFVGVVRRDSSELRPKDEDFRMRQYRSFGGSLEAVFGGRAQRE